MPKTVKYAFRCRSCGHLEEAGQAGERRVPAACRYCGAGVTFDSRTGAKTYDEDNWIVLAELADKELQPILEFHAIARADVVRHRPKPATASREPQSIDRSVADGIGAADLTG